MSAVLERPQQARTAPFATVEMIGPEVAQRYLAVNQINRPLRKAYVARLAAAMKRGEWALTGEPIKFDKDGRAIDGQHRLHAVILSEIEVPFMVVRGLDPAIFRHLDTGRVRSGADVMALRGEKYASALASATRYVAAHDITGTFRIDGKAVGSITNAQRVAVVDRHPGLREWIEDTYRARYMISNPMLAAVCYLSSRGVGGQRVHTFLAEFLDGSALAPTNPAWLLREKMLVSRASKRPIKKVEAAALTIKALNYYRAGRELKILKWSNREDHPEIDQ